MAIWAALHTYQFNVRSNNDKVVKKNSRYDQTEQCELTTIATLVCFIFGLFIFFL